MKFILSECRQLARISRVLACSKTIVRPMDIYNTAKILIVCMLSMAISGCGNKNFSIKNDVDVLSEIAEDAEIDMYEHIVLEFDEIDIMEINEIMTSSDNAANYYFYFGRTTCLYCRKFIIENEEPLKSIENFYYIDTEKLSEDESMLLDEYGITTVPAILTATNSADITLVDMDEFTKNLKEKSI